MITIETTSEYMARKGLKKGDQIGVGQAPTVTIETTTEYMARKAAEEKAAAKPAAKKADD